MLCHNYSAHPFKSMRCPTHIKKRPDALQYKVRCAIFSSYEKVVGREGKKRHKISSVSRVWTKDKCSYFRQILSTQPFQGFQLPIPFSDKLA